MVFIQQSSSFIFLINIITRYIFIETDVRFVIRAKSNSKQKNSIQLRVKNCVKLSGWRPVQLQCISSAIWVQFQCIYSAISVHFQYSFSAHPVQLAQCSFSAVLVYFQCNSSWTDPVNFRWTHWSPIKFSCFWLFWKCCWIDGNVAAILDSGFRNGFLSRQLVSYFDYITSRSLMGWN